MNYPEKNEINGKYIFWYSMIYRKDVCDSILQIGKKYNLPVYVMDAKEWSRRALYLRGVHLARKGGPSSFLSLVKNAEIVFTSSFHGTVFCNTFQKNFWYVNIHDNDTNDDRTAFLLEQLGLKERYIRIKDIPKTNILEPPIYLNDAPIKGTIANSYEFLDQYCM